MHRVLGEGPVARDAHRQPERAVHVRRHQLRESLAIACQRARQGPRIVVELRHDVQGRFQLARPIRLNLLGTRVHVASEPVLVTTPGLIGSCRRRRLCQGPVASSVRAT